MVCSTKLETVFGVHGTLRLNLRVIDTRRRGIRIVYEMVHPLPLLPEPLSESMGVEG